MGNKFTFKKFICLYSLGAFAGFIIETLFHLVIYQELINKQGMLYGPFKPLYGLGAIMVYLIYRNVKEKKYLGVFISGIVIGTFYEYFISFFEEKVFGYNSWLYVDRALSINGRIYLPFCILWGLIILGFYLIIPFLKRFYSYLNEFKWFKVFSICLCIFMIINALLTFGAVIRYTDRANEVKPHTFIERIIDNVYDDYYMKRHFPKMRIVIE